MPKPTSKRCWKCKQIKPITAFYKNRAQLCGRSAECKECNRKSVKEYHQKNKDARLTKMAEYRCKNRTKIKERKLIAKYGLTFADKKRMLEHQNYKCLIGLEKISLKTAQVDHCHTTGKIRGLLCRECNVGLGMFTDRVDSLKRAIKYLEG